MKYFIIACLLNFIGSVYGQKEYRIYNSFEAYNNKNYIILEDTVLTEDINTSFIKSSLGNIWGLEYNNNLYRVLEDKILKVSDTSGIIIYTEIAQKTSQQANIMLLLFSIDATGNPSYIPIVNYEDENYTVKDYYFSIAFNDTISELSKKELIKQVNNKDFTKALRKKFCWFKSITDFNEEKGIYTLNEVYLNSMKQ